MANYALGDIQGCFEEFKLALEKVNFDKKRDYLWLVGDLINRGPDSLKLLKFLYKIKERTHIVLGNHDLHFLACFYKQRKFSKTDTLSKLINAKECSKYANFLSSQPLIFEKEIRHKKKLKKIVMVHAGIPPNLSLEDCMNLNQDFQKALKKNPKKILKEVFSNPFSEFSKKMNKLMTQSIYEITGKKPDLSTSGGTSDARFIAQICPVIEFGLVGQTMHQVDENVLTDDIISLTEIYFLFLRKILC